MNHATVFIDFSTAKLQQLTGRIGAAVENLTEEQVWLRGCENENAVGNLILHLSGNVRQWVITSISGKPDVRVREREFSAMGDISKADLMERLEGTVNEAIGLIEELQPEQLLKIVRVQNYEVTLMEAIYHVVEHFSQHTGQVIFATKLLTGRDLGFYGHRSGKTPDTDQLP
jgi:uncharacterized damage-inducible protein DinB